MTRRSWAALLGALTLLAAAPGPARAYDPTTTHPGLTARAALRSARLHRFLRHEAGLDLGLFAELALDASEIDRRAYHLLRAKHERLDPAGGYRPTDDRQRAAGWLLAGTVLADMPASANRHHFYSPVLRTGLDNRHFVLSPMFSLLGTLEGGDSLRQLLTASGFDLSGASALSWIQATENDHSMPRFHEHLAQAISAPRRTQREHHLALALSALGGLLAVLQDMAEPSHVRNDYLGARLQRLGGSVFDRGSRYEAWVAEAYGQRGLPPAPARTVRFARFVEYFSNAAWTGLADLTATAHFSAGTIPAPVSLPVEDPQQLPRRLNAALPFAEPRIGALDLACAAARTCYLRGAHGPLLAYRIDERQQELRFALDARAFAATARHLLPLAEAYSAAAIDFLLRGKLVVEPAAGDALAALNRGPRLATGELVWLAEDARGTRRRLGAARSTPPTLPGAVMATLDATTRREAAGATRIIALWRGRDAAGEPLLATAIYAPGAPAGPASKPTTAAPLWQEAAPPAPPSTRPAPTTPPIPSEE
jgi:hypothetical protein